MSIPAAMAITRIRVGIAAEKWCYVDATTPTTVMTVMMTVMTVMEPVTPEAAMTSEAMTAVPASNLDHIGIARIGINGRGHVSKLTSSWNCCRRRVSCRSERTHQDNQRGETPTLRTIHCISPELLPSTLSRRVFILPNSAAEAYRSNLRDHFSSRGTRRMRHRIWSVDRCPE